MIFLTEDLWFPAVTEADEDGLVAVGGDLSTERLLLAYRSGIFPWFMEQGLVFWFSPPERFVLLPDEVHISHSMKQVMRKGNITITENHAFQAVIERCAAVNAWKAGSTWISEEFIESYTQLHNLGHAKSVEVWEGDSLVGGLYGVAVGNIFCGESMFSLRSNASKLALIHLCKNGRYKLIDCQVHTPHLASMGAKMVDREFFIRQLTSSM
jgi:leucyl/phenylalanyl-tRNA--protein transferase